ncbi:MAG: 16S rRNA (uracil(1498)-N(3))-methyltransferase [Ruminococcaceae bacterium]|nr:16S rRNA (uracil(1498)-N(3))-methyltransferase [Oscillospiraceae bacterium]
MANFYIDKSDINDNTATITGEEAQHISRVLRMKKGDAVTLCDGEGFFYEAVLSDFSDKTVIADILSKRVAETEPQVKVTVFQGVPKNPKLETIIQKLTEIGAVRLVPVDTKRAVAKLDKENKVDRLRKIAREAAKQSKRGIVPEVLSPVNFKDAVKMAAEADLALIPYEEEREMSLKKALTGKTPKSVSVMIGPEGGFDSEEIQLAKENGITSVTLGKRILRTETAPIAVCSAILYELGEME